MATRFPRAAGWWLAAITLAGFALPAAAEPTMVAVEGSLISRGPALFHADLQITGRAHAIQHEASWAGGDAGGIATIMVRQARLQVLDLSIVRGELDPGGPAGGGVVEGPPAEPRLVHEEVVTGAVTFRANQPGAALRFLPLYADESWPIALQSAGKARLEPPFHYANARLLFTPVHEGRPMVPSGQPGRLQATPTNALNVTAPMVGFAYGALVQWTGQDGKTSWQTGETGDGYGDPLGEAKAGLYHRQYIVVEAETATLTIAADQSERWWTAFEQFETAGSGDFAFTAVDAQTSVDHRFLNETLGMLQLKGTLSTSARYRDGQSEWTVSGEAWFVAADATTVAGSRWASLGLAAGVAGGLGLAAFLFHLVRSWFPGTAAGYARVEALDNPRRAEILRLVQTDPGVTMADLGRRLGVSKPTVAFHARRLQRARLIEGQQVGSRLHYWPLPGQNRIVSGPAGPLGKVVDAPSSRERARSAVLLHPTRQSLVRILRAHGPCTYSEIEAHWKSTAGGAQTVPPRRLMAHHALVLLRDGICKRNPRGREAEWRLANGEEAEP